jgi:hypothetical protein
VFYGLINKIKAFTDFLREEGIFNSEDTADIMWTRWRFIFSFSFPFLKDMQKKVEDKIAGD